MEIISEKERKRPISTNGVLQKKTVMNYETLSIVNLKLMNLKLEITQHIRSNIQVANEEKCI